MAINYNYNFAQLARESGFKLRLFKDGPLDWRLIGCLEVERILRDQSLEQIDGVLNHLSEAPLGSILDTNILDSGIAKYFTLSQFSIQYLLFCRKFLNETVRELRESLVGSQLEVGRLKKSLSEANNEVLQLNKKITQIEAIHEVVFPCHLCTKNFVSNEALNIHIGRKHARASERRNDTPLSGSTQREKDNDRNLINTIKLELEIKQLKERLNVAEKSIRERNGANSDRASAHISSDKLQTKDVAIQSNLIEEKEKDDATFSEDEPTESTTTRERKEQLIKLQEKIVDFEQWRDLQKTHNEESRAEINQKLTEIAQALEASKLQVCDFQKPSNANTPRRNLPNVDQLEKLLTEKVLEIGKASAEKLEEAVFHMEKNYRDKLDELEKEIKRRHEAAAIKSKVITVLERSINANDSKQVGKKEDIAKTVSTEAFHERPKSISAHDETYLIEDLQASQSIIDVQKKISKPLIQEEAYKHLKESLSSESNRTFVKEVAPTSEMKETAKMPNAAFLQHEDDLSTDISETLSEENTESDVEEEHTATDDSEAEKQKNKTMAKELEQPAANKQKVLKLTENALNVEENQKSHKLTPVKFTRKDAKKLSNRRLISLGCDFKTKSISAAGLNKANLELSERRTKLKQKYPNFTATRNRIRKFVDKLCSKKLPENAEAMLRKTQPKRPAGVIKKQLRQPEEDSLGSELELDLEPNASTPITEVEPQSNAAAFKQRLELMLSSPMQQSVIGSALPVPLPRKRVMFNTQQDATQSDDSDDLKVSSDITRN